MKREIKKHQRCCARMMIYDEDVYETCLSILKLNELTVYLQILCFCYVARVLSKLMIISAIAFYIEIMNLLIELPPSIITFSTDSHYMIYYGIFVHGLICHCDLIAKYRRYIYIYINYRLSTARWIILDKTRWKLPVCCCCYFHGFTKKAMNYRIQKVQTIIMIRKLSSWLGCWGWKI